MKNHFINPREVKSLRLLLRTHNLKTILETKSSCMFAMTETLHPTQRILTRKELVEQGLKVSTISKTTTKFLTQNTKWKQIKNLLTGNVVAIVDNENNELSKGALKYILTNKILNPRFLFWKQNIHRRKNIQEYMNSTNIVPIEKTLKHLVLNPYIFINPFIKRSNAIKGHTNLNWNYSHGQI